MSFHVNYNWVDPGPSPDTVMRRTMARLSIEISGTAVTAIRDLRNGRYRKQIIVPLFLVADWIVDNWWYLFNEPADTQEQRPGFEERHTLAYAGSGYLLPRLTFVPTSEQIHVKAERWEPFHSSIAFVEDVETRVEVEELRSEFQRLVDVVIKRIHDLRDDTDVRRISDSWAAINNLDPEELAFSRAAAMCGIDPFDVDDRIAEAITTFWNETDPSIREEALAAADAGLLSQLGDWLGKAVDDLSSTGTENRWNEIRDTVPDLRPQEPWKQGRELARSVRSNLGIGQNPFRFETEGPLALFHSEHGTPNRRIEGLVASATPACVTAPRRYSSSRRFLMARALGNFMSHRESRFGILDSLHTDRQARSRAFAAEFLAPAETLYDRWTSSGSSGETIEELSQEFDVSSLVVMHQIDNYKRGIASA